MSYIYIYETIAWDLIMRNGDFIGNLFHGRYGNIE